MRSALASITGAAIVALFVACGDKPSGDGGAPSDPNSAVGTWSADMTPIVAMMKPMFEGMLKMAESMAGAGADSAEAKKKVDEAKEKLAQLGKAEMVMVLKKDGTATLHAAMPGDKPDDGTGTWTQSGDQVTITPKTSNGEPVSGGKAEPKTMTLKDGVLSMSEGPVTLTFKRK